MQAIESHASPKGPGRPRSFDLDAALDRALVVFRERGYHGASLADLCHAMRLTPGSVYKAFANKRAVFLAAFQRYRAVREDEMEAVIALASTGFGKIEALLRAHVELSLHREGRLGCLVTGSAVERATFDAEMAAQVDTALARLERRLAGLVREGVADGSIDAAVRPEAAAVHLLSVLQGFRVLGKTGRRRDTLDAAVDQTLRSLHSQAGSPES